MLGDGDYCCLRRKHIPVSIIQSHSFPSIIVIIWNSYSLLFILILVGTR